MGKQKADYLLRSDHIFTSTVENPFAGYVAVSGQNILAVGTDDGSDWIDEQTEVLELGDQLVTPGFIDVHTFFTGYAIFHIGIDMSGITSQEEFLQKIKEQVEKEKEPSTVFGHGWNPNGEGINIEHGKRMREKFQGDFVRFSGYNRMTDGTVASTKGDLLEPYEGTNMHCSIQVDYPMIEKEVQLADENGFRYSLHAQGDGAVHKVAGIFDKCQKKDGKLVNRHAVTDMEFSNPADLKKMGEIGVTGEIYFQIMSLDPADDVKKSIEETIGTERGKYFWNRRGMLDGGMTLSGATDLPLMITDIPEAIFHGCGGYFPDGKEQYNVQNTITIAEMLKAWTYGGAYNIGMEDKIGTLEAGKLADIAVLDRNVFEVPMSEMRDVKVSMTMVNGKPVYTKEQ